MLATGNCAAESVERDDSGFCSELNGIGPVETSVSRPFYQTEANVGDLGNASAPLYDCSTLMASCDFAARQVA